MIEDKLLIWRCKQGQGAAFQRVYEKYQAYLVNLAAHLLADPNLAQDVIQDVFVSFVRSVQDFQLTGSLKAYLATCVANKARDYLRSRQRRPQSSLETADQVCTEHPGPVQVVIADEQQQRARRALNDLPFQQREVIALHLHGGLRFRQIAQIQKSSIGTVLSRYRYGLKKLRTLLNGELAE